MLCCLLAGACAAPQGQPLAAVQVQGDPRPLTDQAPDELHAEPPAAPQPVAIAADAADAGRILAIEPPGVPYRFELRFERNFDEERASECDSGPVRLTVTKQGDVAFAQELPFDKICVVRDANGNPVVSRATLSGEAGMFQIGDFNFDGALDFAVQDGHDSCYAGPSYHVFLFDPSQGLFAASEEFTRLGEEGCAFFSVDAEKQELVTGAKPGACYHESARWKVMNGTPEQVYRFTVECRYGPRDGEMTVVETEARLERGRWIERVTQTTEKQ